MRRVVWLAVSLLGGCDLYFDSRTEPDAAPPPVTGPLTHYVVSEVILPRTVREADALAFDVDGSGRARNALGQIFASLSQIGFDVTQPMHTAVVEGDALLLTSIHADSLVTDNTASWQVFAGAPQANPDFSGAGMFKLLPGAPVLPAIRVTIAGGVLHGRGGMVGLPLPAIGALPTSVMRLSAAQVEATCDAVACSSGRMGGGITRPELDATLLPAVAAMLSSRLDADGCTSDPSAPTCTGDDRTVLSLFDRCPSAGICGNHRVEVQELVESSLVKTLLTPDLDLDHDGTKESLSFAFGFKTVRAQFASPE